MSVLLIKLLLLYRTVFSTLKLRLLDSIKIPAPTEKTTFYKACSKAPWYLSISELIE